MSRHTSRELRANCSSNSFARSAFRQRTRASTATFCLRPQLQTLALAASRAPIGRWPATPPALVDPITGEGLYYALRSGELLAEMLIAGPPDAISRRVRDDFSADLQIGARVARHVYPGRFLGGAVTTRMVQFISRSATFRALMGDLFSGAQNYSSLKRRLWRQFGAHGQPKCSSAC